MVRNTAIFIGLLAAVAPGQAFSQGIPAAIGCDTAEVSTVQQRPICEAIDHLEAAMKDIRQLPEDGEDHKAEALSAVRTAIDEVQSYVSPMILAKPENTAPSKHK